MTSHTDLNYLNEMTGGDPEMTHQMFTIFKGQIEELKQNLTASLQAQNWPELSKVAHKSKSTITIMGMSQLAQKMSELEKKAKTQTEPELYENYVSTFHKTCDEAIVELEEKIKLQAPK